MTKKKQRECEVGLITCSDSTPTVLEACVPPPPFFDSNRALPVSQLGWSPAADRVSPQRWISTPDQEECPLVPLVNASFPHYSFHTTCVTPVHHAPLPALW